MERYNVIISLEAEVNIREIIRYVSLQLHQPDTAERLRDKIYHEIFSLDTMPERFPLVNDAVLARQGYRMTNAGKYLLFYTVEQAEKNVTVVRVLHGSRNWAELMQND